MKAVAKALEYEHTPVQIRAHNKSMKKLQTDINNLSSGRILLHLYRRHERDVWVFAFFFSWAVYIWVRLGA